MGLGREEMLDCFRSDDLIGLGMEADAVRRRLHPEGVVTYANVSTRSLPMDNLAAWDLELWIDRTRALGGSGLALDGSATLDAWLALVRQAKRLAPELTVQGLSAAEVLRLTGELRPGEPTEVLARLKDAGLDSILESIIQESTLDLIGGSAQQVSTAEWVAVHRAAHRLAMPTVAAVVAHAGEDVAGRVARLEAIAALQDETGGFVAVTWEPAPAAGRALDGVTAVESLKSLAICRMALNNIPNLQTSWAAEGLKVLQMGLRFGANDVGSVLPPVLSADGEAPASEEDLRRIIRDAGFEPVERDALYRVSYLI